MFRSLHRKLVLILVLLIVSVMAVVGTFLINSINTFYLNSFYEQMQAVFTTDTIRSMQEAAAEPGTDGLKTIIDAHKSRLGIDDYRNYAILDSEGGFLDGSNPNVSVTRTSNVIAAMAGETGTRSAVSDSIMDIAVPLDKNGDGAVDYIVYIADNKRDGYDQTVRIGVREALAAQQVERIQRINFCFHILVSAVDRDHQTRVTARALIAQ